MVNKDCMKKIIFNTLFLLLLFISCLSGLTDIRPIRLLLNYFDELLILVFWCYLLIKYRSIGSKKAVALLWGLVLLLGLISAIVYQYQPIQAVIIDAFAICSKFVVGYLATTIYLRSSNEIITAQIEISAKVITWFLFLLVLHDIFFTSFFEKADYRYFMFSIKLMFDHPTYLATAACTLLIYFGYLNGRKNCALYMLLCTFVAISTFRAKALGFVGVYWLLYMSMIVLKIKNYGVLLGAGGCIAGVIGWNKIHEYYLATDRYSPRSILLKDSIDLMKQHFPLGTGFGSFGSNIAAKYYSPLYTSLGYRFFKGMKPTDTAFLSDGFWPTVFAQFGLCGTVAFLGILLLMVKYTVRKLRVNRYAGFGMLSTLLLLLINSLGETAFFNPTALLLFVLFACYEQECVQAGCCKG